MSVVIAVDAGTTGVRAVRAARRRHRSGLLVPGVHPALPPARLGRARSDRDLDRGADDPRRARRRARRARRGHRDHRSAGDGRGVGSAHRPTAAPRHRLAGPPHGEPLRRAPRRGRRAARAGHHRPRARPVLQRHQGGVAPHRGRRGGHARPGDRHRRRLGPVEPHRRHRRRCARHRAVERQPHHALRHPHAGLVRRAPRPLRGPRGGPPRGSAVERSLRGHGERDGRARRASRCPASPETSRPPSSARPASNPA